MHQMKVFMPLVVVWSGQFDHEVIGHQTAGTKHRSQVQVTGHLLLFTLHIMYFTGFIMFKLYFK